MFFVFLKRCFQKKDHVEHIKITKEGDEYSVTLSKDRRKRFPTFEKLLKYAIDDNEIMKIPLVSKTELEQDDRSSAGSLIRKPSSNSRSDPTVIDRLGLIFKK